MKVQWQVTTAAGVQSAVGIGYRTAPPRHARGCVTCWNALDVRRRLSRGGTKTTVYRLANLRTGQSDVGPEPVVGNHFLVSENRADTNNQRGVVFCLSVFRYPYQAS
jgi:hypothetical protein